MKPTRRRIMIGGIAAMVGLFVGAFWRQKRQAVIHPLSSDRIDPLYDAHTQAVVDAFHEHTIYGMTPEMELTVTDRQGNLRGYVWSDGDISDWSAVE